MSHFIRLLGEEDKGKGLAQACNSIRSGAIEYPCFEIAPELFAAIPGSPFAYWTTESVLKAFSEIPPFATGGREAWVGLQTNDDFQWVRTWWESNDRNSKIFSLAPFAKGGAFSPYYADVYLSVRWGENGLLIKTWKLQQLQDGKISANNSKCWNEKNYFGMGITWPSRTQAFGPRILPSGCVFAHKGPSAFFYGSNKYEILAALSILNSICFRILVETRLNAADATARSFEVGTIGATPFPKVEADQIDVLAGMASELWSRRRNLDTTVETSRAFLLPVSLRPRLEDLEPLSTEAEMAETQAKIDEITFDLYGFTEADRAAALGLAGTDGEDTVCSEEDLDDSKDDDGAEALGQTDSLLSWAVGVAFGRFDWRLATGERKAPPEPDPFAPLLAKSPGMLPEGATPFHDHHGILVDDKGHPHDLPRLIEEVLARVEADAPSDVRRWLQRDFFFLHLQQYSKSRRRAPIYWPLSTSSGSYTLWLYYPSLTSQTLYTAVNDFIEGPNGKLQDVGRELGVLRHKGSARSRDDEKVYEALQTLELELIELRDTLLQIAPTYRPDHDDGVQVTAAPLWQLFRHKPWQKILKDTWATLEMGDYDWAHLAMAYWPDRVREKCKTDKSLALGHDLEHLYVEPEPKAPKTRGRKTRAAE